MKRRVAPTNVQHATAFCLLVLLGTSAQAHSQQHKKSVGAVKITLSQVRKVQSFRPYIPDMIEGDYSLRTIQLAFDRFPTKSGDGPKRPILLLMYVSARGDEIDIIETGKWSGLTVSDVASRVGLIGYFEGVPSSRYPTSFQWGAKGNTVICAISTMGYKRTKEIVERLEK